jgi:HK97 family phage major capsid protein
VAGGCNGSRWRRRGPPLTSCTSLRTRWSPGGARGLRVSGSAFDAHLAAARGKLAQLELAKSDEAILADARELAASVGGFSKAGGGSWASKTAEKLGRVMRGSSDGSKAIVSGSIDIGAPIDSSINVLPDVATTILDLIPRKPVSGTNEFSYLRQTVRTNNAAPVADGATKPTSTFTVEDVTDSCRYVAHLSEPFPIRLFADHADLEQFLQAEMARGVVRGFEDQIINGDGTGANFAGILNTSGIVSVAYASDLLATIRKALTGFQNSGVVPTALALNPAEAEALDLLRDGGATGAYLLGDPAGAAAPNLWRIPRVVSPAIPAGQAVLGDWNRAVVAVREEATAAVDTSGAELFDKNMAKMRVESRLGFGVKVPSSFAVLDLSAS